LPDCWNCGTQQAESHRFCNRCGQVLRPSAAERTGLARRIDYLLREVARWDWLDPSRRTALRSEYERKRHHLLSPPPPQARKVPAPPPHPLPKDRAPGIPPPGGGATEKKTLGWLSAFLEEANIRWLLVLGGLLLASAGIGLMSSQWDAHGRTIVPLALMAAPLGCFLAARSLRANLPHSSRVLALLGGLLLPSGLVSLRLFELGGLSVGWPPWTFAVFLVSSSVWLAMGWTLREILCLYLASAGLAASSAALASWLEHPPTFGLGCLMVAIVWLMAALRGGVPLEPFRSHLFGLSQALTALALFSTFPAFLSTSPGAPLGELSLLVLGAAFMAGTGFLQRSRAAVLWSAPAALAALLLLGLHSGHPPILLGYALVALGGIYSGVGHFLRHQDVQDRSAQAALFVGTVMMGVPLALLLTAFLANGVVSNFSSTPAAELRSAVGVALAATLVHALAGAACALPGLFYASTASLAYAWFMGSVLLHRTQPGLYGLDMSWLPLVWVLLARLLRQTLPAPGPESAAYRGIRPSIRALLYSALFLALLPAPLNLAMKALHVPGAEVSAPKTLLITTLALVLATPLLRSGRILYLASLWGFLAYSLGWAPLLRALGVSPIQNLALDFLPLLGALAVLALWLHRRAGPEFALPIARSTLLLAVGLAFWQLAPEGGSRPLAATALLLYSLGFAALAHPFRDWTFLNGSGTHLLAHLATITLAGSLWVFGGDGKTASHLALMGYSIVALALAGTPLPDSARNALWHVGLACGPLVCLAGPAAAGPHPLLQALFAQGPGVIWLAFSWQTRSPGWLVAGSVLQVLLAAPVQILHGHPALGHTLPGLLGMILMALGLVFRAGGRTGHPPADSESRTAFGPADQPHLKLSLVPAWLFAGAAWDGLLFALRCPEETRIQLWGLFWLLLCAFAALRHCRDLQAGRILITCAWISALLYLARAALVSGPAFLQADLLVAFILLLVGWCRPQEVTFIMGWALLTLAPVQAEFAVLSDGPIPGRASVGLGLLVMMTAMLSPAALRAKRSLLAEILAHLARATSLGAGLLALNDQKPEWATVGLVITALGLWIQAVRKPSRLDWHLGFLAAWGAWAIRLQHAHIDTAEAWLLPPALWLLFWGERHRAEGQRSVADLLAGLGLVMGLGPGLLATALDGPTWHATLLVAGAVTLLLVGVGRRVRVHAVGGSLALLAEIAVQTLKLASRVPWWYVALAAGLLLVGLGALFERRRVDLLGSGQRLFREVAAWESHPNRQDASGQSTNEGREDSRSPR
jgi:hypothetical protein